MNEYKDPSEIKLILSEEKLRNSAEIILSDGNIKTTASVEMEEMNAAIDRVVDTVIKQLRRKSDKKSSLKRRSSAPSPSLISSKKNTPSKKVVVEKLPLKPMSLDEALLQLEVDKKDYFVFRNSDNGEMNVLYSKSSNTVGLITA